jgi:ribosome biogenesis SPOUT family RNA methylase Rps3
MGEMVIISMTIVAVVLIAGISLNGIVDKVMSTKRTRLDATPRPEGIDVRAIAERQQMIEDRLRVLERIATDRGTLLAGEIEALRDETLAISRVKDTA